MIYLKPQHLQLHGTLCCYIDICNERKHACNLLQTLYIINCCKYMFTRHLYLIWRADVIDDVMSRRTFVISKSNMQSRAPVMSSDSFPQQQYFYIDARCTCVLPLKQWTTASKPGASEMGTSDDVIIVLAETNRFCARASLICHFSQPSGIYIFIYYFWWSWWWILLFELFVRHTKVTHTP